MLAELFGINERMVAGITTDFKRYLFDEINWDNRLIVITGARGTGKTFMVLQHFLERYKDIKKCLYISADNPLVLKEGIYNTAAEYFKYHGDCLIIDEVHKQKDWSIHIKALYDAYPDKKFIISGSSTLSILYEKGDLSRRAVIYALQPLSFREYLQIKYKQKLDRYIFTDILTDHIDIARRVSGQFKTILGDFNDFLVRGSYPFFVEYTENDYLQALTNVVDKAIYEDISTIKTLKSFSSVNLKKLAAFVATSQVPLFNLETLKKEIGVTRDTLYEYFDLLNRVEILEIIRPVSKNAGRLKNSKILFKSPNIYFTIAHEFWKANARKGNIRESFFAGQVERVHPVYTSPDVDFRVLVGDRIVEIEVGGRNKRQKQIDGLEDAFVFKDGIEVGYSASIPLYLAGFLY